MTESFTCDEKNTGSEVDSEQHNVSTVQRKVLKKFEENEDVLSRWNDGLLYLGTIIKVDDISEKCLVRFEDNSEHWTLFKDLQKGVNQDSDIVCCLCENGASDTPNEIVICDSCGFGFHQLCHNPEIPCSVLQPEVPWVCRQCTIVMVTKKGLVKKNNSALGIRCPKSFPYDLNLLTWDPGHKTNVQQCYCYCGGPGEWFRKMLQCWKCKQWFHEACVQCLEGPLLYGDRYYYFICSVCNSGTEYVSRLHMKWADLVHLVIYNLTVSHNKKYYEFEDAILAFVNDNWDVLQLKHPFSSCTREERRESMLSALMSNKTRFKSGREIKKKHSIWGLRICIPPPVPKITHTPLGTNSDLLHHNVKPLDKKDGVGSGIASPKVRKRRREADLLLESAASSIPKKENIGHPLLSTEMGKRRRGNPGNGIMKGKSKKNKSNCNGSLKPQKVPDPALQECSAIMKANKNSNITQGFKRFSCNSNNSYVPYESSDDEDTSSHGTLDSIIPPPSNFEGHNHPFRDLNLLPVSGRLGRPIKKKLNHNDIRISKNGEIKQRKFRRGRLGTASEVNNFLMNSSYCGQGLNGFSHLLNEQLSECSIDTSDCELMCNDSMALQTLSPTRISLHDLKSSVHTYFGAATRIASGEKFNVLARRVTPEAKVQYLIEWEGLTA